MLPGLVISHLLVLVGAWFVSIPPEGAGEFDAPAALSNRGTGGGAGSLSLSDLFQEKVELGASSADC